MTSARRRGERAARATLHARRARRRADGQNPFGYFGEGTPRGDHGHTHPNTLTESAVCYHARPGPGVCVGDSRVSRRRRSARVRRLARQQSAVRGVPFLVIVRVVHEQHGVHVFDGVELPQARLGDQSDECDDALPGRARGDFRAAAAAAESAEEKFQRRGFERRGRERRRVFGVARYTCRGPLARWSSWT